MKDSTPKQTARMRAILSEDARRIIDKYRPHIAEVMSLGILGQEKAVAHGLFSVDQLAELYADAVSLLVALIGQEQADRQALEEELESDDQDLTIE